MNRILINDSLLRRNGIKRFLKKLITVEEMWTTYDKDVLKRSWLKVILCVWRDSKGVIHYDLLPPGNTIDSELCCEKLMRLKPELEKKRLEVINRRDVVFHHDKARPHTSLTF